MERQKVSATLITFNEESNIEACLRSISWADEIIVVDSESTDRTVEIAKKYTDKVFTSPWPGHKQQKNIAIDKSSYDWIFSIDADERVTPQLRDFILKTLMNPAASGYRFPRLNHFIGKRMRFGGWYPDHVLRLFRKDKGRFGGINPHDKVEVPDGKIVTVKIPLVHFTYNSLSQYLVKQDFYSSIAAREKYRSNKLYKFMPVTLAIKALWKFLEVYFLKFGILDGTHGFIAAAGASYSTFWKYSKIWEIAKAEKDRNSS